MRTFIFEFIYLLATFDISSNFSIDDFSKSCRLGGIMGRPLSLRVSKVSGAFKSSSEGNSNVSIGSVVVLFISACIFAKRASFCLTIS